MTQSHPRPHSDSVYQTLKTAVGVAVRAVGGQEAATMLSRITAHVSFGRYIRRQDAEHCPIDVAIDLDAEAGGAPILHAMAQALDYVVFAKPRRDADPAWIAHLGRLAQESGQTMGALAEALADDGKIDAGEVRALGLRARVADVMEALGQIDAALAALEQGAANEHKTPSRPVSG